MLFICFFNVLRYLRLPHNHFYLLIQPGEEYRPQSYVHKLMLHFVSDEPWEVWGEPYNV